MRTELVARHTSDGRQRPAAPVLDDAAARVLLPFTVRRVGRVTLALRLALLLAAEVLASRVDASAARFAATLPHEQVRIWTFITEFGTSGYMFAVSAGIAVAALIMRRHVDDAGLRARVGVLMRAASFFFACIAVSGIAAQTVKHLVGRMRPKFLADAGAFDLLGPTLHRGADSFPSGHTTSAFAAAVALGMISPRLRVPLLLAACLIAVSRVMTGNHYPSDVLAGAALGASASWTVAMILAGRGVLFRKVG